MILNWITASTGARAESARKKRARFLWCSWSKKRLMGQTRSRFMPFKRNSIGWFGQKSILCSRVSLFWATAGDIRWTRSCWPRKNFYLVSCKKCKTTLLAELGDSASEISLQVKSVNLPFLYGGLATMHQTEVFLQGSVRLSVWVKNVDESYFTDNIYQ